MTHTRRNLPRLARIVSRAIPVYPFSVDQNRNGVLTIGIRRGWRRAFVYFGGRELYTSDNAHYGSVITVGRVEDSNESLSAALVAALSRPEWFLNP